MKGFEILPRKGLLSDLKNTFCAIDESICNGVVDLIFGPSENQRSNVSKQFIIKS